MDRTPPPPFAAAFGAATPPAPSLAVGAAVPPPRPGRIALPRRQPRYRASMTALADMMFQLLVFFMLSTNIVPFSMLDVRTGGLGTAGGPAGTDGDAPAPAPGTVTGIGATAVWTLAGDGRITAGGQRFAPARLPALVEALIAQGTPAVLLVVRPEVEVQGVVDVLQALAARGVTAVQLAEGG